MSSVDNIEMLVSPVLHDKTSNAILLPIRNLFLVAEFTMKDELSEVRK